VYPPRTPVEQGPQPHASTSATPASGLSPLSDDERDLPIHPIGGDLKIPAKETAAKDDPTRYYYWVEVLEPEKERSHEKGKLAVKYSVKGELSGSFMEVRCGVMR
jgi:bromodomain adjacent to zinc finger domain protein 1A